MRFGVAPPSAPRQPRRAPPPAYGAYTAAGPQHRSRFRPVPSTTCARSLRRGNSPPSALTHCKCARARGGKGYCEIAGEVLVPTHLTYFCCFSFHVLDVILICIHVAFYIIPLAASFLTLGNGNSVSAPVQRRASPLPPHHSAHHYPAYEAVKIERPPARK